MATYAGYDLGMVFEFSPSPGPTGLQVSAYPGVNGLDVVVMGSRGGTTTVRGAFSAPTGAALGAKFAIFHDLVALASANVLVDEALGRTYSGVILRQFSEVGQTRPVVGGGYAKRYQAQFFHIG